LHLKKKFFTVVAGKWVTENAKTLEAVWFEMN